MQADAGEELAVPHFRKFKPDPGCYRGRRQYVVPQETFGFVVRPILVAQICFQGQFDADRDKMERGFGVTTSAVQETARCIAQECWVVLHPVRVHSVSNIPRK